MFIQLLNLADTESSSSWERMAWFRMPYGKLSKSKVSKSVRTLERQEGGSVSPGGMQ